MGVVQKHSDASAPPDGRPQRWLVFAEEAFVPADAGGRVESLNLLRAASAAGVRLHVVVPGIDGTELAAHREALPGVDMERIDRRTGWRAHASVRPYLFASRPLPADLTARLHGRHAATPYTAVVAVSFRVAHHAVAMAEALDLPAVVRPHNIESRYFHQLAGGRRMPGKLPYLVESWKLRRAESVIHGCPRVVLFAEIAEEEVVGRTALTSAPVLHVPPFLPATPPHTAGVPARCDREGGTVLFLGALDNGNNQDGVRWFTGECWPQLHRDRPTVDLHVVGRRVPAQLLRELHSAGVRVTADAPEVASHLAAADVFVNPVRHGAGINIKMVEAMAAGLPVVSTSVGARGLHWRDGEHLVVADDPAAFRTAVTSLLDDPGRRADLARAGRRFVEELDGVGQIRRMIGAIAAHTGAH